MQVLADQPTCGMVGKVSDYQTRSGTCLRIDGSGQLQSRENHTESPVMAQPEARNDTRPDTRTRILDVAQAGVVAKGFDATSIDEITTEAGISRAGFFYHFPDKSALALALLERYVAEEEVMFDALEARASDLSDDPLQQLLIFLRLLSEALSDMPNGHPGCIVATAAYQDRLFDRSVGAANRAACLNWRRRFRTMLDRVAERTPPADAVDLDDLADTICTTVEGGIVMAKAMADPGLTARQVLVLRGFLKRTFAA
jgi:TetR/AcrR family transcriptional regulator, transcriptional repressor for nem operon